MFDNETQEETDALEVQVGEDLEGDSEELELEGDEAPDGDDDPDIDDAENSEDDGAATLSITIEGEEPEGDEGDSVVIRDMRKKIAEEKARAKELEAKLKAYESPDIELGEKPSLEAYDYNAEAFEAALLDWNERKRALDSQKAEQEREVEERKAAYAKRLEAYAAQKAALGARDFDEAEEAVLSDLSQDQQSLIVALSESPEIVVYALGKNDKVRKELAGQRDLAAFSYALAKLESKMKVTNKTKPKPEKRVSGSRGAALTADKKLEQLEAEADRTGDRTKVLEYKRSLKKKD